MIVPGLKCDARNQASSFLVPWCCVLSFRHILTSLETVSQHLDLEYSLFAGSTLGAVKLGKTCSCNKTNRSRHRLTAEFKFIIMVTLTYCRFKTEIPNMVRVYLVTCQF